MTQREDPVHEEFFGHEHSTDIGAEPRPLRAELREMWAYRDLLLLLVRRDISVRYKQSALGLVWVAVQPISMMLIFTLVFGRFAKLPSDGYPYPLFTFCALLPWLYFSKTLTGASTSLVASSRMLTKVYFPRLILPLAKALSGLLDLGVALLVLGVLLAWYRVVPGPAIMLLPAFIAIAMFTALALALWLTALNVRYRDVALVVPFIVQIWMYLSPIAYSITLVPEKYRWLYSLNPMAGVAEGFRWAVLGKTPPSFLPLAVSLSVIAVVFALGLRYFRRAEQEFADLV